MFPAVVYAKDGAAGAEVLLVPPTDPDGVAAEDLVVTYMFGPRNPHERWPIPMEENFSFLRRVGRLLCASEQLLEDAIAEITREEPQEWTVVRDWRWGDDRVAQMLQNQRTSSRICCLAMVCFEPHCEWMTQENEGAPLVGIPRLVGRTEMMGVGQSKCACVIICPRHGVEVCRIEMPGEFGTTEVAWRVFARVMHSALHRITPACRGLGSPLVVRCPEGGHGVIAYKCEANCSHPTQLPR
jgi:hypothetical protein